MASSVGRRAGSASTVSSGRSRASSSLPRQVSESPIISIPSDGWRRSGRKPLTRHGRATLWVLDGKRSVPCAAAWRDSARDAGGRRQALVVVAIGLGEGHVDAGRAGALRRVADARRGSGRAGTRSSSPRRSSRPSSAWHCRDVDRGREAEALRLAPRAQASAPKVLRKGTAPVDAPVREQPRPWVYARPRRSQSSAPEAAVVGGRRVGPAAASERGTTEQRRPGSDTATSPSDAQRERSAEACATSSSGAKSPRAAVREPKPTPARSTAGTIVTQRGARNRSPQCRSRRHWSRAASNRPTAGRSSAPTGPRRRSVCTRLSECDGLEVTRRPW